MKRNVPYWLPIAGLAMILALGLILPVIQAASEDANPLLHTRVAPVDTGGNRISPAAAGEAATAATTIGGGKTLADLNTSLAAAATNASAASVLYNGGGASNALQTKATGALVVASGAAVVNCANKNTLELQLINSTASQSCTLLVAEFSAATPTVATQIRALEVSVPTTDQTATMDRAAFGLVTGTEYAPKTPIAIRVTPGSYVMITVAASLGGTWYARYTLQTR